eukprot:767566-Hanusia_phi.AAC.11
MTPICYTKVPHPSVTPSGRYSRTAVETHESPGHGRGPMRLPGPGSHALSVVTPASGVTSAAAPGAAPQIPGEHASPHWGVSPSLLGRLADRQ